MMVIRYLIVVELCTLFPVCGDHPLLKSEKIALDQPLKVVGRRDKSSTLARGFMLTWAGLCQRSTFLAGSAFYPPLPVRDIKPDPNIISQTACHFVSALLPFARILWK